jgi:zinc protease
VESIREKEGGTYGVGVGAGYQKRPIKQGFIQLSFDTDPDKASRMVELLHVEINNLIDNGPTESDIQKAKEYFLKSHADRLKENNYWMSVLQDKYIEQIDVASGYIDRVNALTADGIKQFAKKTFSANRLVEVIMLPAQKSE